MGQTLRDLGSTIKDAKVSLKNGDAGKDGKKQNTLEDDYEDDFENS